MNSRAEECDRDVAILRGCARGGLVLFVWLAAAGTLNAQGVQRPQSTDLTQVQIDGPPADAGEAGDEIPTDEGEDFRGLHLPSDRTASRGLAMAAEGIQNGQFSQAIRFLDRLLSDEEDAFADLRIGATHVAGLKAEARRLLGELPQSAREDYVSTYGTTAKKRLEAAAASGDLREVERIARQFFHTPAGYEASFMLAMVERDMGRPLAAASLLQELVESGPAVAHLGPQLLVHTAIAWRDAGHLEQAKAELVKLKEQFASTTIDIGGQQRPLFTSQQDPLNWLEAFVGEAAITSVDLQEHWTTYRGNAARNGVANGGSPHMQVRWRARVTNSPQLEGLLSSLRRGYQRRGIVTLPATQPISVGDVVLMRTTENLVGVDFNTGNMIWDVRAEADEDLKQLMAAAENSDAAETSPQLAHALEQRMWDDAVFGTISSDGERVYVLRGLPLSIFDEANWQQFGGFRPGRGGVRIVRGRIIGPNEADDGVSPTNTLTAVELRSEGKRVWEVNGADVGGKLAGAFFLGPPLCVDGRLYVLAEIKSSIYLVVLRNVEAHPHWELEWMQQLASLEIGIDLDPHRRLAGAMPSFQGGTLICPTSAGVVVAVDLTKRSLLWAYRYPLREQDVPQVPGFAATGLAEAPGARTNERWLDATAVLADGKVLLTPRESNELYCLDLHSGDLTWKRPRGDGLFIAGVHEGVVAIVGTDRIDAVRLDNGLRAWASDHTLLPDGAVPSGRGFLSDGKYFLPLTSAEVIAVDMDNGQIASRVRSRDGQVLGNLIAHRGAIVAQSELLLEKYDQKDAFRERTEKLLEANPSDPTALRNLGELELTEGNLSKAVAFLKASLASDASNRQTHKLLVQAILDGLEEDFSLFRDDLPLVRRLAVQPDQRARLARVTAIGLQSTGDVLAAFENYVQLAAIDREMPQVQSMSPNWEARTSRWIRAQLHELWQAASAEERTQMQTILHDRHFVPSEETPRDETLLSFAYYGSLPAWDALRRQTAAALVAAGPSLHAQITIADLCRLGGDANEDWIASLQEELRTAIGRPKQQPPWPTGRILVERKAIAASEQHDRFQSLRVDGQVDPALHGYRLFLDQVQQSLVFVDPYGVVERTVGLMSPSDPNVGFETRGRCHGVLSGHLLVVSFGEKIVAVDLLGTEGTSSGSVLWEAATIEPFEGLAAQVTYPRLAQHRQGFQEFGKADWAHAVDESGRPLGWIGPVGPAGVVFQAQGELRSVDPLTGEINWLRRDLPPGCVLFGDDQYIFALPYQSTEVMVFRAEDGKQLDTRAVPPLQEYFAFDGRRILCWRDGRTGGGAQRKFLELADAWTGNAVWNKEFHIDSQICSVEGEWIGVMDRTGRFELIDIASGEVMLSQSLLAEPTLGRIFVLRSRNRIVLVADQYGRRPAAAIGGAVNISSIYEPDYPIVTGRVYVFDRATGKSLLPVPAEVDLQGLALHQPVELPVLGFVCHTRESGAQGNRNNISLLVLKKATGGSIERADIPDATTMRFRMYRDEENANVMHIDMANHRVRLEFTDEAAAPEPPADSDVEGTRKKPGVRGVWGIFSETSPRGVGDGKLAGIPATR